MPDWYDIALDISRYYSATRGIGHTNAAIKGVGNPDTNAILVVGDQRSADRIKVETRGQVDCLPVDQIYKLIRSKSRPIVFDNYAIMLLLEGLVTDNKSIYVSQQNMIRELQREIYEKNEVINVLIRRNAELGEQAKPFWQKVKELFTGSESVA